MAVCLRRGVGITPFKLWRVSDGALVRTLTGHTSGVYSVAFSPDGSLIASGSGDATIKLWRVSDGALVATLTGHTDWVYSVAFSPDGSLIASGSYDRTIRLWRVSDGALVATLTLRGHTYWVYSVAFSPDGSLLASGSWDATIKLWRVSDGALVRTLTGHTSWVYSVAFSPDGSLIASGSDDRTIKLWRVSDGALVATLTGHTDIVTSVAFSPDGSLLASGSDDRTIRLWRVSDGALVRTLTGHTGWVTSVAFSPDGSLLASGSGDATIKLWRVSDGALVATLTGHTIRSPALPFLLMAVCWRRGVGIAPFKLWRVSDGALVRTLTGHTGWVYSVAFSPDGSLIASGSEDLTIRLWRVSDGALVRTLTGHTSGVYSVAFSPDGSLIASGSRDRTIRLWRVSDGALVAILTGHTDTVNSVAFSPDGRLLASVSWDRTIKLWRVSDGALVATLTGHTNSVTSVAFSPDGSLLASGSGDRTIRLWGASDGALVATLTGHTDIVTSVAFSPDGRLIASGSRDRTIRLWRVSDGALVATLTGHTDWVNSVAFSPDGSLIASGSYDRTIRLWRVSDGALVATLTGHTGDVNSVAFSPDGSLLASGSGDATIKLWRVSDGALVATLTGHRYPVLSVSFSPDGRLLASGSGDDTVRLWRVSDGALVRTLTGHTWDVHSVAFSPDGRLIASASGGWDRTIRLWRVSDGALVQTYDQETGTEVLSIQFSPNGQLFGYGRGDATVVVARNPFTVEDRDPPDTFIVEGPEEGALVCREPVRFRWGGTDDATPPDQLYFRWRLDGGDWSDWTRDTSVELTGLSDGEHTFEVQARDLADRIDETPASRTFRFRNDPNPPQISNIQVDAQINRATIQWTTDEPSTSQVEYRRQGETTWQRTNLDTNLVTDHTVTITGLVGNRTYEFRVLSRDECGNEAVSEIGTFTVRAVDLQVTALQVPQEIWNDTQFDIAWQITSAGSLPAAGWLDRVYFSRDDRVDGSDRLIGEYPFAGTLEPGQSVSRTQVVSIPRSWISPEGTYYIIVVTDATNQHNEGDREDNNTLARALQARLIPLPDLIVPSIQAPAAAFFGQTIEVRWQVRNQGEGATTGTWYDRVLLARDAGGQSVVAQISRPNESALGAGEGYNSVANLAIPRGLVGRYYLIVEADSERNLLEENESNNRSQAIAINIAVPPLPDLVAPQVVAPAQSYAGQSVRVRWRVENRGTRDIPAGERGFYDALYLSTDTTLDSRDRFVGNRYFGENLLPGEGYTVVDFPMTIPRDLPAGDYYLLVLTDSTNRVYEFEGEQNNVGVSATPIQVMAVPPNTIDLQVEAIEASSSGQAGETISVRWRIVNDGADAAPASWTDAVYLSSSPTFDRNRATRLATFVYTNNLPAGESYERTEIVRLPDCLPAGQYYLFVVTDDANQVVEYNPPADAEANNTSNAAPITTQLQSPDLTITITSSPSQAVSGSQITVAWRVRNEGNRATRVSSWVDRVSLVHADGSIVRVLGEFPRNGVLNPGEKYDREVSVQLPANLAGSYRIRVDADANNNVVECNAEGNNAASAPIQLSYPPLPNLQAGQVGVNPSSVQILRPVTVSWQVANAGEASASGWTDAIYLSRTPNLSGAIFLTRVPAAGALAPGQSYTQQATVTIPIVSPGDYYVLVMADDTGRVFEGDNEGDNIAYVFPLQVGLPSVDVTVEGVDAPSEATAGLTAEIVWTVRNLGSEATYRAWSDVVILSRDLLLDPTDPVVGSYRHTTPLGAGESRTVRFTIQVPAHLTGPYYVFVVSDYGNELSETDERNNVGVDTQAMVITVAPPADLVVESMSVPGVGSPGTPMPIQWVVRNIGSNAAVGEWYDSVYLSTDDRWDINDTLIGRFERSGRLEPGASYTGQLNEPLPGVVPGNYYIIVRTDARNTIREVDDSNNVGVAGPVALDVIELQLGVPFSNTLLPNARSHYYKVLVPREHEGKTLLWHVDSVVDSAEVDLLVRYARMVSRSAYDYAGEPPLRADKQASIPEASPGYYYGLVYGADIGQGTAYQTLVEVPRLGIREVLPNVVGNAGFATLRILGAQLRGVQTAFLVSDTGVRYTARRLYPVSSSEVYALFNMEAVPEGVYDVGVSLRSGEEAVLEDGLVVETTDGRPQLSVRISGPSLVRPGTWATYYITVYNSGRNDAIGAIVVVRIPAGTAYSIPGLPPVSAEAEALGLLPHYEPGDGWRYIVLVVPHVPTQSSVTIRLMIQVPSDLDIEAKAIGSLEPSGLGCLSETASNLEEQLSSFGIEVEGCRLDLDEWLHDQMLELWSPFFPFPPAGQPPLAPFFPFPPVLGLRLWEALSDCTGSAVETTIILEGVTLASWSADDCSSSDSQHVQAATAIDPNEKQSPAGFGEERFVPRREAIPYTILFENLPSAQAYARQVVITDQLDPDLDWRTFEVGTISFRGGRYMVEAPPGQRFFQTEVQMREEDGGLRVQILAGVDITTGQVTFRLTAIDPQTGEPPTSPLLGILPPNNEQREGEGFVTFRVKPKRTVPTGTVITNSATIVFDTEDPLTTNEVFNTVDALPPTTSVEVSASYTNRPSFMVRWSGADDEGGSGLRSYTVWVSVDGRAVPCVAKRCDDYAGAV
jgi:WD40 repeat protein/subtilase family serine protease